MNDDLISRAAAIDAMEDVDWYHINKDGQLIHGANSKEDEPLYKAEDVYKVLNDMPSAQPNLQPTCNQLATVAKDTNVPINDCISRQSAIDALKNERSDWNCDYNVPIDHCIDAIYSVPSAQPYDYSDGYADGYKQGQKDAQPERKTGRWIPQDHNKSNGMVSTAVFYYPKCSECGHSGNYDMNFCPNCGAKMEDTRDIPMEYFESGGR